MIIAQTNSKGGVGKSTLAVHLVVWLKEQGRTVALVDADVQGSSSVWLREAEPQVEVVRLQTPDDVLDQIPRMLTQFDDIVIDGPAGLSEVTRAILLLADLACLPCGPSVLDLRAANDAIRVVRQVRQIRQGPPAVILVPNKLQVRYRLSMEFLETARSLEIPSTSGLHLRQAYADAAGQGTVVWRLNTRSGREATEEIQTLFREMSTYDGWRKTIDEPSVANG